MLLKEGSTACLFPLLCGSRGSKTRFAKTAREEPSGQIRGEKFVRCCGAKQISRLKCQKHLMPGALLQAEMSKVHVVVAGSTFQKQDVENAAGLEQFWKLRCSKSARCCAAAHF